MEQERWNYEHANPNGKTVFIFRDTFHRNFEVQRRIANEAERLVRGNYFKILFIEGFSGVYNPELYGFSSERQLIDKTKAQLGQDPNSAEILAYRLRKEIKDGDFQIYGAEDEKLFKEHITITKKLAEIAKKIKEGKKNIEDELIWGHLYNRHMSISNKRSVASARTVAQEMARRRINSAGIIFGEGHYEGLCSLLNENNIGFVDFSTGITNKDPEEGLKYALSL